MNKFVRLFHDVPGDSARLGHDKFCSSDRHRRSSRSILAGSAVGVGLTVIGAGLRHRPLGRLGPGEHGSPARSRRQHSDGDDHRGSPDRRLHVLRVVHLHDEDVCKRLAIPSSRRIIRTRLSGDRNRVNSLAYSAGGAFVLFRPARSGACAQERKAETKAAEHAEAQRAGG